MVLFFVFGLLIKSFIAFDSLCFALLFLSSVILIGINIKNKNRFFMLGLLILSMLFGIFYMNLRLDNRFLKSGEYLIEARLNTAIVKKEKGFRARLYKAYITDEKGQKIPVGRLYWSFNDYLDKLPKEGDLIRFKGYLYKPSKAMNPFAYDFQKSLLGSGIFYGVSGSEDFVNISETHSISRNPIKNFKLILAKNIDSGFKKTSGMQKALIIGIKSDLPDEQRLEFRRSGIAHLFAISGFHISLIALVFEFVLRNLGVSKRKSFLICSMFLLLYCVLLNFVPSAFRAMLMYSFVALAKVLRTRRDGLSLCAISAFIILIISPNQIYDIGFQLSFMAVLGIIIMGDLFKSLADKAENKLLRRFENKPQARIIKLIRPLVDGYLVAFSAILFTAPLSIHYFSYFSITGLIFGPLFVFLMGLLLPFNVLSLALYSVFGAKLMFLTRIADELSLCFIRLNSRVLALNLPNIGTGGISLYIAFCLILIFIILSRFINKNIKFKLALSALILVLILFVPGLFKSKSIKYIQFSVGRADSGIVELDGKIYAIDCGYEAEALLPYLRNRRMEIEALFITHLHKDHVGGVKNLLENGVKIKKAYFPMNARVARDIDNSFDYIENLRLHGVPVEFLSRGDSLDFGRLKISVVWPYKNAFYSNKKANNTSLALLMRLDDVTLLCAGDLGGEYEKYCLVPSDILKLSHHGSRYSSYSPVTKMVEPRVALISNSARFEHMTRLSSLRSRASVFSTAQKGAIIIDIHGENYKIYNYLREENQWTH